MSKTEELWKVKPPKEFKKWISERWGWKNLPIGGVVPFPATSLEFQTGEWRAITPVVDQEKCTGCTLCFYVCPDDAIRLDEQAFKAIINYNLCKGCTLCHDICKPGAITLKEGMNP